MDKQKEVEFKNHKILSLLAFPLSFSFSLPTSDMYICIKIHVKFFRAYLSITQKGLRRYPTCKLTSFLATVLWMLTKDIGLLAQRWQGRVGGNNKLLLIATA